MTNNMTDESKNDPNNDIAELSYLTLNNTLDQVIAFSSTNRYQSPQPNETKLKEYEVEMRELFILDERINLLPNSAPKEQLEKIAALYIPTHNGSVNLYMACPDPEEAKHWFDYQKEYKTRLKQLENLTILIEWEQDFYQKILSLAPALPIPFPPIDDYQASKAQLTNAVQSTRKSQKEGNDTLPEMIV